MANLSNVLNEQIRRVARREINRETSTTRKQAAQYRRDIAALKREVTDLQRTVDFLRRQEKRRVTQEPAPEQADGVRFRADGLKSHRAKLGFSAKDYATLLGVSMLTVYNWEQGKSKPRQAQLAKIASVRSLGKREALKRLELLSGGK